MNSGNSPASVSQYVKKHGISWPVIVDSDRSFEAAIGINEITLQNIWQARVIKASGEVVGGNASELEKSAESALSGATWNIDPTQIALELQATWLQVEFGSYAPAASDLKRFAKSRKPETKASATLLNDYVAEKLQHEVDTAAAALNSDDSWTAYKTLSGVEVRFKGFEIPDSVKTDIAKLAQEETVKGQIAAWRQFELARKSATSSSAAGRKRVQLQLKKIVDEFPDTDAAKEASSLLSQVTSKTTLSEPEN